MPTYNKLVRDRIPEIIRAEGRACEVSILSQSAYRRALLEKLVEEASEAAAADAEHLVTELADHAEVVEALLVTTGIAQAQVRTEQRKRRAERGGFELRLCLVSVD